VERRQITLNELPIRLNEFLSEQLINTKQDADIAMKRLRKLKKHIQKRTTKKNNYKTLLFTNFYNLKQGEI